MVRKPVSPALPTPFIGAVKPWCHPLLHALIAWHCTDSLLANTWWKKHFFLKNQTKGENTKGVYK